MGDSDHLQPNIVEDPDGLLDFVDDPDYISDTEEDDIDYLSNLPEVDPYDVPPNLRGIPFTRRQNAVNITHKIENITGTKTSISIDFRNTHRRLWHSVEGDVTTIFERTYPAFTSKVYLDKDNANLLWSPTETDSLIRTMMSFFRIPCEFRSLNEFAELETQVSVYLCNLVSNAKDEGYSAMDVVVVIDIATVDTYNQEEVERIARESASVAGPVVRFSIEALSSHVLDDINSYDECSICLDGYSRGMTVTQLPCSHDFHRGCIERWLPINNSCPTCRSPI
ncbi:hypothetical protein MRB53_028867 [Persea americana]|uniref:Uncharacterized protein n=1 Tax=Persea americana TaxID=3435 RepID=A0ACC2KHH1_PERAE|nr:hypothetical protein MRB53_028867 [Persea americana]|eukprot:TRINITY_DN24446_c0_g1_i1.p1 TRINITY_DN24446_c0_g1~~TRINITY_DN24446_c0_g1_i1.p1  ORF type:complete len:281 (-),score=20.04 TRINITY_DN24446_c0_g1_i1:195-1037(-)